MTVIEAELHPPHFAWRRVTIRPSTLLGFQALAAALRPVGTGVQAHISVVACVTLGLHTAPYDDGHNMPHKASGFAWHVVLRLRPLRRQMAAQ